MNLRDFPYFIGSFNDLLFIRKFPCLIHLLCGAFNDDKLPTVQPVQQGVHLPVDGSFGGALVLEYVLVKGK